MVSTNILEKYLKCINNKEQLQTLLEEAIFEILALEAENMAQGEAISTLEANIEGMKNELNVERTKAYIQEVIKNKERYINHEK